MKIGIITHYYKSKNYGGNLQAYALCKFLNNTGHSAEQLCAMYSHATIPNNKKPNIIKKIFSIPKIGFSVIKYRLTILNKTIPNNIENFRNFNENVIANNNKELSADELKDIVDKYDAFITGSDQVWNMSSFFAPYFLDFVPSDKVKLSYAASLGASDIDETDVEVFKEYLKDFKAVSVREESVVKQLEEICDREILHTIDPTMLLSKEEWKEITAKRIVEDNYIYAYLLGEDIKQREIIMKFAKEKNLKVVNIPYIHAWHRKCDDNFADIKLYDITPEKYLSLIKNAEYIFTDSFHSAVFSGIFQKQYFVFERHEYKSMATRLYTLLDLYEAEERFCDSKEKESIEYVKSLKDIDYTKPLKKLEEKREFSKNFLISNLK